MASRRAARRSSTRRRRDGAQVYCAAALANGNIVSGSLDETLKVWDVPSGNCLRTLRGHRYGARRRRPGQTACHSSQADAARAQVRCVTVLANGRVVSGSHDHYLKLWDAATGECVQTLEGHTSYARRPCPAKFRRSLSQ